MKKMLMALAALLITTATAYADITLGQAAPAFTATDSNGNTVNLSDYAGKTVVLEWSNHECPFVRKHYGSNNMQATQKSATDDSVIWLTVVSSAPGKQGSVDGAKANELTASRNASPSAVLLDPTGAVGQLYQAKTTPHMFIIDPTGKLAYHGAIDSIASPDPADIPKATNYVTAALADMKAGRSVATPSTASYGCSIKY